MPQLNPNPWFLIMFASWLTYSMVLQPKILPFIFINPPSTKASPTHKHHSWNWPWT